MKKRLEKLVNGLPSVLGSVDTSVLEWMHRHATPTGMAVCVAISHLGSPEAMAVLALAGAAVLVVLGEWIVLGGWALAFAGAGVLDTWLKDVFHRPRPAYAAALMHHPTWSFPSGHAMGSLVGYGMLAYVVLVLGVGRGNPRRQLLVIGSAAILIVAIGASRLYLGVHYLSDVVGGFAAGLIWLAACVAAVEIGRRGQRRTLRFNPTS